MGLGVHKSKVVNPKRDPLKAHALHAPCPSPSTAQQTMAQLEMPAWVDKPTSEASAEERAAFVLLGEDVGNLPVMKAALERDPAWAGVTNESVRLL